MTHPVNVITERVRARVRRDGVDLSRNTALASQLVEDEIRDYSERALGGGQPLIDDESRARREVVASLTGFGALQPLLDDPSIEEIWINNPARVFVSRGGKNELTPIVLTEQGVRELVERMLQASGRRVDMSQPFVDATLADGSRLHVVIPDITKSHIAVNIRKFSRRIRELHQLVEAGSLSHQAAEFLRMCMLSQQNVLIAGATQSGKTTLLGALVQCVRSTERVVTVEETFELDLSTRDVVSMQCRGPSLEGSGEITLRRLVKEALRMRPDRLIVGEVREAESLDLLVALNSGVAGACSIHANSARDALSKLSLLPLLAGRNIDANFVVPSVASCIDIVVYCEMDKNGRRRVTEILAPSGQVTATASGGQIIEASQIFRSEGNELVATGGYPSKLAKFASNGFNPAIVLGQRG